MRKFTISFRVIAVIVLALVGQGLATADVMYSSLPAWQAAVGTWTETTSLGAPGTVVNGVALADGTTLGFGGNLTIEKIGTGWATWCCGYAGDVVYSPNGLTVENWTISPVAGFGMFIEPDPFSILNITLTLSTGDTLTQAVNGDHGAAFFGWVGTDVTNLQISSSTDFAEGDFFSSSVPEPTAFALFGTVLAGVVLVRRRRART